jgi:guanylate kinase
MKPFPLVLSAPSGGGKTTIANALVKARDDVGYSVSATTRPPRPGEQDGVDYHFISRAQFERRVKAGEFIEWAEYGGELYGTLQAEVEGVLSSGRHAVLDIEIQGARAMRERYPDAVLVFIVPPTAEELMRRLGGPTGTRAHSLVSRLRRAVEELHEAPAYDYLVVNANRTETVAEVAAILDAEARRPRRNPDLAEDLTALGHEIGSLADRLDKRKED